MPPNTQRRPGGGGAAAQSLACEPRSNSTALTTEEVLADRLPALIDRARSKLAEARTSAEVLEAKHVAEAALHYAKVTDAANEAHADCLRIITRAEIRLAREIDAGQERGEIAGPGQRSNVRASDISDLDDLGLDRRRVAEWRDLAEAGEQAVDAAIDEVVEEARTARRVVTKAAVARRVAKKTKTTPRWRGPAFPASKSDSEDRRKQADRNALVEVISRYHKRGAGGVLLVLLRKLVPELEAAVASSHIAVSTSPEERPVASLAERPKLGEAEEAENAIIDCW